SPSFAATKTSWETQYPTIRSSIRAGSGLPPVFFRAVTVESFLRSRHLDASGGRSVASERSRRRPIVRTAIVGTVLGLASAALSGSAQDKVDFAKQIQPIFQARCLKCHGPQKQKGKLRFDRKASVFKADKDEWPIVPGKSVDSDLYRRITLPKDDPDRI